MNQSQTQAQTSYRPQLEKAANILKALDHNTPQPYGLPIRGYRTDPISRASMSMSDFQALTLQFHERTLELLADQVVTLERGESTYVGSLGWLGDGEWELSFLICPVGQRPSTVTILFGTSQVYSITWDMEHDRALLGVCPF